MERANIDAVCHILTEYESRGLVGIGTAHQKQLFESCLKDTGLTSKQLKNWIGNRKRKVRNDSEGVKKKFGVRQSSAKDMFYRKRLRDLSHLSQGERLKAVAAEWRELKGSTEAESFKQEAKSVKKLSDASREDKDASALLASCHYKQMTKLVTEMENNDEEVLVLTYNKQTGICNRFGSESGLSFASTRTDVETNFLAFVSGTVQNKDVTSLPALQSKVTEIFNRRYGLVCSGSHCSYKAVKEGRVKVHGLPDNVPFKHPKWLGRNQLQLILANADNIQFSIEEPLVDVTASGETGVTEASALITSDSNYSSTVAEPPTDDMSSVLVVLEAEAVGNNSAFAVEEHLTDMPNSVEMGVDGTSTFGSNSVAEPVTDDLNSVLVVVESEPALNKSMFTIEDPLPNIAKSMEMAFDESLANDTFGTSLAELIDISGTSQSVSRKPEPEVSQNQKSTKVARHSKSKAQRKTNEKKQQGQSSDERKKKMGKCRKANSKKSAASLSTDETPCSICAVRFCDPPYDDWQQCAKCSSWYHVSCGPDDTDICYMCLG